MIKIFKKLIIEQIVDNFPNNLVAIFLLLFIKLYIVILDENVTKSPEAIE